MPAASVRIAFLTPEFVTELADAGGLASYLARMVQALKESGHRPEVITLSDGPNGTIDYDGVPVHRVHRSHVDTRLWRRLSYTCAKRKIPLEYSANKIAGAWQLARRLEELHAQHAYDIVQSSDFGIAGLFVRRRPERTHVVRCSWVGELFMGSDDAHAPFTLRTMGRLERRCLRRADRAYAPSRFVAEYYRTHHSLALGVVRPPLYELGPARDLPAPLPDKFLIHFGQLSERKGTDVVAAALPRVWAEAPDVRMVWAGKELTPDIVARSRELWGEHAAKVTYLGAIDRGALYTTISRAVASVLPSRLDNLPNTVIESLALGVPVIGSAGASIDELVEDGVNGRLVPIGDAHALARAMITTWSSQPPLRATPVPVLADMAPERAVAALLSFATSKARLPVGAPHDQPNPSRSP